MKSDEMVPKVKVVDLTEKSLRIYLRKYFKDIITMRGRVGEMWTKLSTYLIEPIFVDIKDCELVYIRTYALEVQNQVR